MRILLSILIALIQVSIFSQSHDIELSVLQNNKKVKLKNKEGTIDKAPFILVVKFQKVSKYTSLGVLVGTTSEFKHKSMEPIKEGHSDFFINSSSGAGSYFNTEKSIKAGEYDRITYFGYSSDTTHDYNTLKYKGDWLIGERIIANVSTPDAYIPIEAWKDSVMYIVVSHVTYDKGKLIESYRAYCHLNINPIVVPLLDVRGKTFNGAPGEWQDGCEGCGNGGGFEFSMNGKQVDFYLPGSDTGSFSEYIQEGNKIIIGKEITLTIAEDGKTITDNKYGTVFILKNNLNL